MNDLEQLREDVRASAPEPRPQFAARLERNVEAGFEPAPRPRRRLNLWAPGVALACTALIAVVIGLSSMSNGSDDEGSNASAPLIVQDSGESEAGSGAGAAPPDEALPAPETRSLPGASEGTAARLAPDRRVRDGRRIVEQRTGLELETGADRFTEVADDVLRVADDTGSIVQSSRVTEQEGRGFARFDLRVPASRLDETLADLSRLAHVTSRTASSQDITRAYVSAADRLQDARAERRALLKALEKAETEAQADSLRRQISFARSRIAIAQSELERLRRRADRAKVSVTVRSTGRKTEGGAWTPGDALDDAGRILEVAAGVVVVAAAALLPIAILAAFAALAARSLRRRRREAALDAA